MVNGTDWQPTASIAAMRARAQIIGKIRGFFAARNVLEVETPVLARYAVTDPHIDAIAVQLQEPCPYYLQTSPEYAMKRLLASGSGDIFQLTKAFRSGDVGRMHNPEFTMLEWYRVGFDHLQLMAETDALLQTVLQTPPATQITYAALFQQHLGIDPHASSIELLKNCAVNNKIHFSAAMLAEYSIDDWLNLLFATCIEPRLVGDRPWLVYAYPASQAALAKITTDPNGVAVASRFEVYYQGLELANGYHELTDAVQQQNRFRRDQTIRQQLHKAEIQIDQRLMAALSAGLPECAGIALGVDRLVMLALGANSIQAAIAFPIDIA